MRNYPNFSTESLGASAPSSPSNLVAGVGHFSSAAWSPSSVAVQSRVMTRWQASAPVSPVRNFQNFGLQAADGRWRNAPRIGAAICSWPDVLTDKCATSNPLLSSVAASLALLLESASASAGSP